MWHRGSAVRWRVQGLIGVLHDDSALVRQYAAYALGRIGPPAHAAIPALEAMQAQDSDSNTRGHATMALDAIAPPATVTPTAVPAPLDLRYRIVVGAHAAPALTGHVWLYAVRPSSVTRRMLATIVDGRTHIELTAADLANGWSGEDWETEGNPETYFVAIELPGNQWYRSSAFGFYGLWGELSEQVNELGTTTPRGEETLLQLPAPRQRRVVLQFPDGRPASGLTVRVAIDFAVLGRCEIHEGIDVGTFHTDGGGALTFRAPLMQLYLDIPYFVKTETGRYCREEHGINIEPEDSVVLQQLWEVHASDRDFVLTVRNAEHQPVSGVDVVHTLCIVNCCGANYGTLATTDGAGVAHVRFAPETTDNLRLEIAGGEERELSEAELRLLFTTGRLTITW